MSHSVSHILFHHICWNMSYYRSYHSSQEHSLPHRSHLLVSIRLMHSVLGRTGSNQVHNISVDTECKFHHLLHMTHSLWNKYSHSGFPTNYHGTLKREMFILQQQYTVSHSMLKTALYGTFMCKRKMSTCLFIV